MRTPERGKDRGDEVDPTGVRALLSALPEPGPMPEDLVARIHRSLQEESRRRPPGRAESGRRHLVSLETKRRRRHPSRVLSLVGVAAAAALVVTVASAQLFGGTPSTDMSAQYPPAQSGTGAGTDEQAVVEGEAAQEDAAQEDSGGEQPAAADGGGGDSSVDDNPMADGSEDDGPLEAAGRPGQAEITVLGGQAELDSEAFATQVLSWQGDEAAAVTASSLTAEQAASCAQVLGEALEAEASVTAGRAVLDGKEGVLLVRTEPRPQRAWVVTATCQEGTGEVLHGPVDLG